ncbi:DUF4326 domain-containing protein [Nonomuraea jabiensis]|uniref:DUF4326 domain-containing protein n=1 Tax=Nonomuraea jabiensis TaxID=882448 RepID=UPI003417F771
MPHRVKVEGDRFHGRVPEGARRELRGKDLACWCDPDQECHADALPAVVAGAEP